MKSFVRLHEGALWLRRVVIDEAGVVSFEYAIVAACVVAALLGVFGTDDTSGISKALSDGIGRIIAQLP